MHLSQKTMWRMALVSVVVCIAIMGADGQNKSGTCCTQTSTENIMVPITGFQLQRRNPPCVKAVIFFTTEGPKCSHWREKWVFDKIRELKKLQESEKGVGQNSTMTTPLTTSSD